MAKVFLMEPVTNHSFLLFIGQGHLQHAGTEWESSPCLYSNAYFKISHVSLQEAIYFKYGAPFFIQRSETYATTDDDDVFAPSS